MRWNESIVAGDHNGHLSTWDTRMFKLVDQKESVHLCKYDTGLTCIIRVKEKLLTAGADGIVRIFSWIMIYKSIFY